MERTAWNENALMFDTSVYVITNLDNDLRTATNVWIDRLRHRDHRFEWTRQEFSDWANRAAETHGYTISAREAQHVADEEQFIDLVVDALG